MKYFLLASLLFSSVLAQAALVQIDNAALGDYKLAAIEAIREMEKATSKPPCSVAFPAAYKGNLMESAYIMQDIYQAQIGFLDDANGQPLLKFDKQIQSSSPNALALISTEISTLSDKKTISYVKRTYSIQDTVNVGTLEKPVFALTMVVHHISQCFPN